MAIAMANLKHKIITKILADRMAKILPIIISKEQKAFVHDMSIKDGICLTSKVGNMLHKRSYGGNMAMKVDISKPLIH